MIIQTPTRIMSRSTYRLLELTAFLGIPRGSLRVEGQFPCCDNNMTAQDVRNALKKFHDFYPSIPDDKAELILSSVRTRMRNIEPAFNSKTIPYHEDENQYSSQMPHYSFKDVIREI